MTLPTTRPTTLPPLRREVIVSCDRDTAYRRWVDEIGAWWPMGAHSVFGDGATVAFAGDTIVETAPTGETAVWGTVTEADPPEGLSFTWHPGQTADDATQVSVSFTATDDPQLTLVTLVHTGWEAYADPTAARDSYASGWVGVLDRLADTTV